ncbi:hypothetical protein BAY61_30915 [Prauserella marina]|uniref:Putative adhesin n=1 Tax=Prauserella marina TaxID=530584 RepID=A0A222VXY9_9PSEU|nr:DUF4097 family beta strand repeat-containing protein [Prauserella marina]ASR38682.1 hypothetical protein BAY61_30915 [Prauserella marina]PWV82018.1 putative adhesin [Prauserella marina]SDD17561.1 Putative adhesin [Prauserella marina]
MRVGLAIGGVVMVGIGVAIATGVLAESNKDAEHTVQERVRHVELATDAGDVDITVADVEETTIRQHFEYRWSDPEGDFFSMRDGTLRLESCGFSCSIDYEVIVPVGTSIGGGGDSGDLTFSGVGSVDVHADSGNVTVDDVAGPVSVVVDSGNVSGNGLGGTVQAEVKSGNVTLELTEARDVSASAASGNIEVTVPRGPYRVEGSTDSGDREIGIATDPSAELVLDVVTNSGNVTIENA